jgi:uncharacterized protein
MDTKNSDNAIFNPQEARVLACLMEKQLTTPKNYPLTLNSLTLACNQKSSREPIMTLTEGQVGHLANTLSDHGYVTVEYGERANRFKHKMPQHFNLERKQQAILTVLMLRGALTLNEIKVRTARMVDFSGNDEIVEILEDFLTREKPLAMLHTGISGQREDRYSHTLCGEVQIEQLKNLGKSTAIPAPESIDRLQKLEQRIEELEERLQALENQRFGNSAGQEIAQE